MLLDDVIASETKQSGLLLRLRAARNDGLQMFFYNLKV